MLISQAASSDPNQTMLTPHPPLSSGYIYIMVTDFYFVQAVLSFQIFWLCTAHTFIHYKLSSLIHLLYAKFGLACTADKQIFQAITQCHCMLTEPVLQPLHHLHIIFCVHTVVFICFCKNFFETAYPTIPACSCSSNKIVPRILSHVPLSFC